MSLDLFTDRDAEESTPILKVSRAHTFSPYLVNKVSRLCIVCVLLPLRRSIRIRIAERTARLLHVAFVSATHLYHSSLMPFLTDRQAVLRNFSD